VGALQGALIDRYLPKPALLHPYPLNGFLAKHPNKSCAR